MSSSESSLESPSPRASSEASGHAADHEPPSLERLVLHFVAAKRSLAVSSHVYRATELVTSSRILLEDIAILNAKNLFATRTMTEQLKLLADVRLIIIDDVDNVSASFSADIETLDRADARLKTTLESLRQTIVDASLQRRTDILPDAKLETDAPHNDDHGLVEQKTLYDFIDSTTHDSLLASLYGLIDSYHHARNELEDGLQRFELSTKELTHVLIDAPGPLDKPTIYDEPPPTIEQLFRNLEMHATNMASLLHNLVSHYDLCVSALRHTEGGGEAARMAIQATDGTAISENAPAAADESLYGQHVPDPISDDDRAEMLAVLEKDALEVPEVTLEVKDLAAEMEAQYSQLSRHAVQARTRHRSLHSVLTRLHDLRRDSIPTHVQMARVFTGQTWPEIHDALQAKTTELVDLCAFYESFLSGYAALLTEKRRRESSEAQVLRVAEKARREMERLFAAEHKARETFMSDVGGYLPRDIWSGLEESVQKWEIRKVESLD